MDADIYLLDMLQTLLARSNESMIKSYVYFAMSKVGHPSIHEYTITVCINGKCFHGPTILTAIEAALNGTRSDSPTKECSKTLYEQLPPPF